MKINKKLTMLLIIIVFFILIIFALLINTNKEKSEILILECSRTADLNNFSTSSIIQVYKYAEGVKVLNLNEDTINDKISSIFDSNTLERIAQTYKEQQKNKIEDMFGNDYQFVEYNVDQEGLSIKTEIIYYINKSSFEKMKEVFDYNLYEATEQEIKTIFEEGGYICKNH